MAFENDTERMELLNDGKKWLQDYMMEYDDEKYKEDAIYMKNFYPPMCRELLPYIDEVCDKEEYEGSPIFDEYPDKVRIWKMMDEVYEMASYMEKMYRPVLEEDEQLQSNGHCISCRGTDNWLKNLISALMVNEIHYRRRRYFKRKKRLASPAWR